MASDQLVDDLLALRRVLRQVSHPVRRGEITSQQFWLLRHLGTYGPSSVSDLAAGLGVSPSSATIAVKRLERSGLVLRLRDTADERVVRVFLTASGNEQLNEWRGRRRDALSGLLATLDADERCRLQELVERVLDAAGESVGTPDE